MSRTTSTLSKRQQKTRILLMDALLRLVVEHGLDNITVTDITHAANYGRWVFYQYFESKEDAALQAFSYWMDQLDVMLIQAVSHLPTPEREYRSWQLIFTAFQQQAPFLMRLDSVLQSRWRNYAKEFVISQFLEHLKVGRFALMEGVRPEIAARLYVTCLMELLEHWGNNPELGDQDALVDEFFTFIFNQPPPK